MALAKAGDRLVRLRACGADVEPERSGDLVVARAAGVDLAADVAELALDRRVHVLVALVDLLDRRELLRHLGELCVVEDPGRVQALRVQERALQVVGEQLRVVGVEEVPDLGRELAADAAGPQLHSVHPSFSSMRRASVMSLIFTCELADAVGRR